MNTVSVEPDIANLTRSLCELWQRAENDDRGLGLTRSLTQNLIVVTDVHRVVEMHDAIDELLARHPCRTILVVTHDDPVELTGDLIARIRMQGRCRAMVLEKLTLNADWTHYAKLPNLIRPLLVNDIPTSLFWASRLPTSLGRVTAMTTMVDKVIIDSSLFDGDDWRAVRDLIDHRPLDLAWLRVGPWRRSLAEAFEHFEWQPDDAPTRVILEHGPTPGSLGAARCLEHWLQRKLAADVRLVRLPGKGPDGQPWRLDLTHADAHVQIRHLMSESRLQTDLTLVDRCLLPKHAAASRGTRAGLLAAALDARAAMPL